MTDTFLPTCSTCGLTGTDYIQIYADNNLTHIQNSKIKTPDLVCKQCGNSIDCSFVKSNDINMGAKLIIINGPSGSYKTSISYLISTYYDYIQVDGEGMRQSLVQKSKQNRLCLDDVHADILFMTENLLNMGKNVVISQTIDPDFWLLYDYFLREKNINYNLITLMPSYTELHLDKKQYGANLPDDEFRELEYQKFLSSDILKPSFYDNSEESAEQTVLQLVNTFLIQKELSIIKQGKFAKKYAHYSDKISF